jgi:hypothetical protein
MKATVSWPRVPQARVWWAEERSKRADVGRVSFMFVGFVRFCDERSWGVR